VRRVTSVMVPEGRAADSLAAAPRTSAPQRASGETVAASAVVELTRSLERMEADLAEMRAEVERMRRHLASDATVSVRRPRR
jgi:tRNA isopentenyl-2-thiomethyl-A-37 hydroxylase MiaE